MADGVVPSRGPTALPKNRGTGFEEFFADPPMTPAEAREEQDEIYADDLSFEERIQSCIQRFRARRRWSGERDRYFGEYMLLGGIDTHPKSFQGQDRRALKDMTPAERRDATAYDTVNTDTGLDTKAERFYNGDREHWSVDFTGVAAGFFSQSLVQLTGQENDEMHDAISVVENFLRYVLQHDVCPEYDMDVKGALQVCEDARTEWPMISRLQGRLPGPFNVAARDCFPLDANVETSPRVAVSNDDEMAKLYGLKPKVKKDNPKAHLIASLALLGENELVEALSDPSRLVVKEFECTLQVVEVHRPESDVLDAFRTLRLGEGEAPEATRIRPVGKATFRPAVIENQFDQPFIKNPVLRRKIVTLFFDDSILRNLKKHMKMGLILAELDNGFLFVRGLVDVVPSFYTFLPQELMKYHKPPVKNERPGPSIYDDGAEGDIDEEHGEKGLEEAKEG